MLDRRRLLTAFQWLKVVGIGLILISGLRGQANAAGTLPENGTDQDICRSGSPPFCLFNLPTGFNPFEIKFRSDPDALIEGPEATDLLTVMFPGEAERFASGETNGINQIGFVSAGQLPLDTVSISSLSDFGFSDRIDLFFDTVNNKLSVTFVSDGAVVPEPATALILSPGLAVLLGYLWLRRRQTKSVWTCRYT